MNEIEIVTLIRTNLTKAGVGKKEDPCRIITQYWTLGGELVFEIDPYKTEKSNTIGKTF